MQRHHSTPYEKPSEPAKDRANAFANVPANARRRPKQKRSPLGYYLAALRRADNHPLLVLEGAVGAELARRIWSAALLGELDGAVREVKAAGARPRVVWRAYERVEDARHLRRFVRFVLLVLERCGTESGKAASSKLWLGATRDGTRYVPAREQVAIAGSLAHRVGVGVRELERWIAVVEAAGVWQAWQPKEKGARAPEKFPRELRGETYAYQHYQVIGGLPRVLRENLEAWYRKGVKRPAVDKLAATPAARAPSMPPPTAAPDLEGAEQLAHLLGQLRNRPPT